MVIGTLTALPPEEAVRTWLAEQTFGSLRPVEVSVLREVDFDDRDAWIFQVILPDPPVDSGTWPVEDTFLLRLEVRDKAIDTGLSWPWYVRFKAVTDDPPHPDDDDG